MKKLANRLYHKPTSLRMVATPVSITIHSADMKTDFYIQ
jgi:hypothetical protein